MKRYLLLFLLFSNTLFAGTITTSLSTLPAFGNVYPFHSSTSLRYTVSGSALTGDLEITAPAGFEVSLTYTYGYSRKVSITPSSGTVATTNVYIRFSPSAAGAASGNVANTSTGSSAVNVSVSGTGIAWAIPAGYYSTVNSQTGAALKTVLRAVVATGYNQVGYNGVWSAYNTTEVQPNGKLWDIYSTLFNQASPYEFTLGSSQQDNGTGGTIEGDKFNREHSFPQSWFNDAEPMKSDLHHLFGTDKKVNNVRGNYTYGTVSAPSFTSLIGGKFGPNTYPGYAGGDAFEPIDEYKGDVARAHLYLATRYENQINGWVGANYGTSGQILAGNNFPVFLPWYVNMLLEWNNLDPVSDKEIKRNNAIYALQNNRNPFIDSPQLVARIWGGAIPAEPAIAGSTLEFSNKTNNSMQLSWKSGNGNRRLVVLRAVSSAEAAPSDNIFYSANTAFGSGAATGTGNFVVYNGTGSNVTVTGLTTGTAYYATVYEYNGWYSTSNYQTTGALSSSSNTLPVTLLSFTAKPGENNNVELAWQTGSEINNDHFTIERSTDAENFTSIGEIKGAGNSRNVTSYAFTDKTVPEGFAVMYYRLKQVDFDGRSTLTSTVSVSLPTGISDLQQSLQNISPNPFSDEIRMYLNTGKKVNVTVEIHNLIGQKYVSFQKEIDGPQFVVLPGLDNLPRGMYIITVSSEGAAGNARLIKQ